MIKISVKSVSREFKTAKTASQWIKNEIAKYAGAVHWSEVVEEMDMTANVIKEEKKKIDARLDELRYERDSHKNPELGNLASQAVQSIDWEQSHPEKAEELEDLEIIATLGGLDMSKTHNHPTNDQQTQTRRRSK